MKKVICIIASVVFLTNAKAQYNSKQNVADFNAIEVNSAAHVELMQGDTNYVSLSSKDSSVKIPKMDVVGGVLEINSIFHHGKIIVHVKDIRSIKVDEAAKVTCIDTLTTGDLTIHVTDAGSAEIMVHAKNLDVRSADASYIELSGTADNLHAKVTDASHVDATELKSTNVSATSADGSLLAVWAVSSIDANATDGSTINVRGTPTQKNTSASDGAAIKMFNNSWVMPRKSTSFGMVETDTNAKGKVVHSIKGDGFIGGGFVMGGSNGLNIKYGSSREFIVGFGNLYPIYKRDILGIDLYYKSTDFYLTKSSFITNDTNTHYLAQKISLQNFGGLVFDRLLIGKQSFIDAGIYGDWTFHSRLVTWSNNPDGSESKTVLTNLSYANSGNYGVTVRYMPVIGVMFYFNYRLSPALQGTVDGLESPKLPNCVLGVTFGF